MEKDYDKLKVGCNKKLVLGVISVVVGVATAILSKKKECDICGGSGFYYGETYGNYAPEIYDCKCSK